MDLPKSWYLPELVHFEYSYRYLQFPIYDYAPNLESLMITDLVFFQKRRIVPALV